MYKMTTDESLLLREIISNLEAEIRDAKESGRYDEHWISQMTFRRTCLKRRLGWADIVQAEELGRSHYPKLLETGMAISPGEYHILQTNISKCREMIQMMWGMRDSPKWKTRLNRAMQELRGLINEDLSCVVVPERLVPHRSFEPIVDLEELVYRPE